MRFFRSTKRQMHGLNAKMPPPPASLKSSAGQKETTIVYTGGALCVTLQRAKSRFLEEEGPTRLVWSKKQQRLGLTFVELPQRGLAVKDVPDMRSDVSPGQELIGVSKESVIGKSMQEVLEMLQSAPSPYVLDFTPPPSPIMVPKFWNQLGC